MHPRMMRMHNYGLACPPLQLWFSLFQLTKFRRVFSGMFIVRLRAGIEVLDWWGNLKTKHFCNYYKGLTGVLSNCWGPTKDTKRTRGRLDRNVAPCSRPTTNVIGPLHECKKVCPWMQESVSMNARKCVHECKKVCPCTKALPQSGIRAWIKQGRRKRKKRGRETGKTEARRLMERKAKQKHIWGTKTRPTWAQIG